jgi:magnesium transporter
MARRRYKRVKPGASPGTLSIAPDAQKSSVRIVAYGPDGYEQMQCTDLQQVADRWKKWPVVWVDVDGLGDLAVIEGLGRICGLHRLALEDALNGVQRPKAELYEQVYFVVVRMMMMKHSELASEQFNIFFGKGFVVTFQEKGGDVLDPVRDRIQGNKGKIRLMGADYLAYALIDAITDHYFPILEALGERLEHLEQAIVESESHDIMTRIYEVKRDMLTLRRAIWPQRDALNVLLRDDSELVTQETRMFLRDCFDHTVQIVELIESDREMASSLMDVHLSRLSHRMNEIMKVLTMFSVIFSPMTFFAGIWGMNFHTAGSPWNMPELRWYWGYPFALGVMGTVPLVMLWYFRRKGWIGT